MTVPVDAEVHAIQVSLTRVETKVDALDRLISSQRDGDQKALQIAQSAAEKALGLASKASDKQSESADEMRGIVNAALAGAVTRDYMDMRLGPLEEARERRLGGNATQQQLIAWGVAAVGVAAAIVGFTR